MSELPLTVSIPLASALASIFFVYKRNVVAGGGVVDGDRDSIIRHKLPGAWQDFELVSVARGNIKLLIPDKVFRRVVDTDETLEGPLLDPNHTRVDYFGWVPLQQAATLARGAKIDNILTYCRDMIVDDVVRDTIVLGAMCEWVHLVWFVNEPVSVDELDRMPSNVLVFFSAFGTRDLEAIAIALGAPHAQMGQLVPVGFGPRPHRTEVVDSLFQIEHQMYKEEQADLVEYGDDGSYVDVLETMTLYLAWVAPAGAGIVKFRPLRRFKAWLDSRCYSVVSPSFVRSIAPSPCAQESDWAGLDHERRERLVRHDNIVWEQVEGTCFIHSVVNALKDGALRSAMEAHCRDSVSAFASTAMDVMNELVHKISRVDSVRNALSMVFDLDEDVPGHVLRCALFQRIMTMDTSEDAPTTWDFRRRTERAYVYVAAMYNAALEDIDEGGMTDKAALSLMHGLVSSSRSWLACVGEDVEVALSRHRVLVRTKATGMDVDGEAQAGLCGVITMEWPWNRGDGHAIAFVRDREGAVFVGESGLARGHVDTPRKYMPFDTYRENVECMWFSKHKKQVRHIDWCRAVRFDVQDKRRDGGGGAKSAYDEYAYATAATADSTDDTTIKAANADVRVEIQRGANLMSYLHNLETLLLAFMCVDRTV